MEGKGSGRRRTCNRQGGDILERFTQADGICIEASMVDGGSGDMVGHRTDNAAIGCAAIRERDGVE